MILTFGSQRVWCSLTEKIELCEKITDVSVRECDDKLRRMVRSEFVDSTLFYEEKFGWMKFEICSIKSDANVLVKHYEGYNILNRLSLFFEDHIKITVKVILDTSDEIVILNSAEMTINPHNDYRIECPITIATDHDSGRHDILHLQEAMIRVQIVANIVLPDDEILKIVKETVPISWCLWKRHPYTDVVILASNQRFKVHKCFLAVASHVFEELFATGLNEVDMTVFFNGAVEAFLQYVYLNKVPGEKFGEHDSLREKVLAGEVFCIAHKYKVTTLKVMIASYLCNPNHHPLPAHMALKIYIELMSAETVCDKALKANTLRILLSSYEKLSSLLDSISEDEAEVVLNDIRVHKQRQLTP